MSLTSDIVDLGKDFEKMFFEDPYDNTWTLLKSSKNKDSILSIFSLFSFVKNFVSQSLEKSLQLLS